VNVLVIGGGIFVGRHITDALQSAGHRVTQFNRGIAAPPRSDLETIAGDRMHDLGLLGARTWDAVVDTCAYVPQAVRLSTEALKGRVARYVFISTLSVCDYDRAGKGDRIDENVPRATLPPEADVTTMTPETYGALKALCEDVVLDAFVDRATILRCGLMVGPYDPTDRFTYWVVRYARSGRMLGPEGPQTPMQFIDARDMAAFVVHALEGQSGGIFNLTGLPETTTFGTLFAECARVAGVQPEIVWLDRDAIARAGLKEWEEIPLWIADPEFMRKFHNAGVDRALAAGLAFRPLADTVRDTLAWAQTRPADYRGKHGMTAEREAEALATALNPGSS
jgi:2'-hydroxyisoflavone reductase